MRKISILIIIFGIALALVLGSAGSVTVTAGTDDQTTIQKCIDDNYNPDKSIIWNLDKIVRCLNANKIYNPQGLQHAVTECYSATKSLRGTERTKQFTWCMNAHGFLLASKYKCWTTKDNCCNTFASNIDPDCAITEVCGDNIDNDKDGFVDENCLINGETCSNDWQCQSTWCDACSGTCTDKVTQEVCGDSCDNNRDGQIDEEGAVGCSTYYIDSDADTYGTTLNKCLCAATGQYTATQNSDCDDTNAAINPGATEVCNGIDDNCNGSVDEGFDLDGDGFTTCAGDCNDEDATTYPGATEVCGDLLDNNCDGKVDEYCGQMWSNCTGDWQCQSNVCYQGFCGLPEGPEICGNGWDDDRDGLIDEGCNSNGALCIADYQCQTNWCDLCNGVCSDPITTDTCGDFCDNDRNGCIDDLCLHLGETCQANCQCGFNTYVCDYYTKTCM